MSLPPEVLKLRHLRRVKQRNKSRFRATGTMAAAFAGLLGAGVVFVVHARANVHGNPPLAHRPSQVAMHQVLSPDATRVPAVIWPVEQRSNSVVYSNGLEIRGEFSTTSRPRVYHTFSIENLERSQGEFTTPAGIVFHTTESLLLPLQPGEARNLVRTREDLIHHVRVGMLYNFLIDRFGQVFRIVPEEQVAFHAGHSIWADTDRVFDGLNDSFIGVAFESQTGETVEPAQIRAGRLLTEYLRGQYGIREADCVTHAQVSVNPENMRIGFHTDWATDFPFEQLGLHQGYLSVVPSVALFGFRFDREFLDAIGGKAWPGLTAAEESVRREAEARGKETEVYRRVLRERYQRLRSHANATESKRAG